MGLKVGIDLQREYMEIAVYNPEKNQVDMPLGEGVMSRIPNALFFPKNGGAMSIGNQAIEENLTKPGDFFDDLISSLTDPSVIVRDGKEMDSVDLFCMMVKLQLDLALGSEATNIEKLIISTPEPDRHVLDAIKRFSAFIHLDSDKVELISSPIAMLFYVFQQDSGVYRDGVGLFHYEKDHMRYEHVNVDRYSRPMKIKIENEIIPVGLVADAAALSSELKMARAPRDDEQDMRDEAFLAIAKHFINGKDKKVSGVFLMGDDYSEEWLKASADFLCRGRRVFVGQNLYSKGACYAAVSGSAAMGSDIFLESDTMVHYDIGVKVSYKGKEMIAPIVLGEQEWFNAYGSVEVILDDTNQLEIDLYDNERQSMLQEFIEIKGLVKRPARTTKLSISVKYLSNKVGEIVIKDKGFGDLYKTTGKIYKKEFKLP